MASSYEEDVLRLAQERGLGARWTSEAGDVEADLAEARAEIEAEIAETDSPARIARLEADLQRMERRSELKIHELQTRAQADADRLAARAASARDVAEAKALEDQSHAARVQAEELSKLDRTIKARNDADARRNAREKAAEKKRDVAAQEKARAALAKAIRQAGKATSILSTSSSTRFMDAAINVGVAAATVVYTATRPGNQSVGFAAFWTLAGGLAFVESSAELKYAGGAISAANAAYLAMRLFGLAKVEPSVSVTQIPGTGTSG